MSKQAQKDHLFFVQHKKYNENYNLVSSSQNIMIYICMYPQNEK